MTPMTAAAASRVLVAFVLGAGVAFVVGIARRPRVDPSRSGRVGRDLRVHPPLADRTRV